MKIALITGTGGLIGSEAVSFFSDKFDVLVGIDNDMRKIFFGESASTEWNVKKIKDKFSNYIHHNIDIRDNGSVEALFKEYGTDISLIVHCAAQPSHDWASKAPFVDFGINAQGTLNFLEYTRQYAPQAVFIFCSTNKVYGDTPNTLPLIELETRYECDPSHQYAKYGIDEQMSIDHSTHSLFGASKCAADLLVQEYGRYFTMNTATFRGGCLTGPNHSGAVLHGFLNYLMRCAIDKTPYTIFGYKGKQVRDNIHASDLVSMFWEFYKSPRMGAVYNAGGSRHLNCSLIEAVRLCEELTGNPMQLNYQEQNRIGDHIWYVSDVRKFKQDYPDWEYQYTKEKLFAEIYTVIAENKRR